MDGEEFDFFQKGGGKVGCFVAFHLVLGGCPAIGYAKR